MSEYRREIARAALAEYEAWVTDGSGGPLSGEAIGQLAICARWLLETPQDPGAVPRAVSCCGEPGRS